jgi:hypothetical protein
MPWYIAVRDEIGEGVSGGFGQFARLTKGKDALGVKGDCELGPQTWLNLGNGKAEAACHGFGDVGVVSRKNQPPVRPRKTAPPELTPATECVIIQLSG